jgi:DNA-binding MarR family transcriptional regulator
MSKIDPKRAAGFLIGRVSHALSLRVREFLAEAELPLTAEEIATLTVIVHLKSPVRMGPLADLLGKDPTTLKRQLDGLVDGGLVARERSAEDGRAVVVAATEAGRKLTLTTLPLTLALRKRAMRGISKQDGETLVRTLLKMLDNLQDDPGA